MKTEDLKIFEKDNMKIVITQQNGKELFPATEIASLLGYKNPHKAINDHCRKDGVTFCEVIDVMGRPQNMKFINEGNLYRLIVKSKLPESEKFETWVFDEVLPSIRKNGKYELPQLTEMQMIAKIAEHQDQTEKRLVNLENKFDSVVTLESGKQRQIQKAVAKRVYERTYSIVNSTKVKKYPNGDDFTEKETEETIKRIRSYYFSALYRELKNKFGVASYKDIKVVEFDLAMSWIENWIEDKEILN